MLQSAVFPFSDYPIAVVRALEETGFEQRIRSENRIILKPNLLEDIGPPTTTDVRCVEAAVIFIRKRFEGKKILIAEGSGGCETEHAFRLLGYSGLAEKYEISLVDLDRDRTVKIRVPAPPSVETGIPPRNNT